MNSLIKLVVLGLIVYGLKITTVNFMYEYQEARFANQDSVLVVDSKIDSL